MDHVPCFIFIFISISKPILHRTEMLSLITEITFAIKPLLSTYFHYIHTDITYTRLPSSTSTIRLSFVYTASIFYHTTHPLNYNKNQIAPKIPKKPSLISNFLSCVINNQKHFILHSWMPSTALRNSRSFMAHTTWYIYNLRNSDGCV